MNINNFFAELNGLTFENMVNTVKVAEQARDNLFNANHRGQMLANYGYTEAQRVTVGDLCQQ